MTKLSVNINKVATIRNARGGNNPDLVQFAINCERYGADGITIHPRPDERHIKKRDVFLLKKAVKTELNIEGFPSKDFIDLVLEVKPNQVTLVPDPPNILTSNAGWDTIQNQNFLKKTIKKFKESEIRTSLFVEAEKNMILAAKDTNTDRIELYTEEYARNYTKNKNKAIKPFIDAANIAAEINLDLNAGHDLDLNNLNFFFSNIIKLKEVSIGHALICDALYFGLENTIQMYKRNLK
ncbi:MAG: pyridoxine 5'-phosphate synthase [Flavobacteriales bacterium]|nr:pyridoxine 5'-phosphate synthase [Flavobacteriales bacterium]|tara:strand:- start:24094 stop:24807 length:714 start_codon:yes stop_codon:yes gene_type:complete